MTSSDIKDQPRHVSLQQSDFTTQADFEKARELIIKAERLAVQEERYKVVTAIGERANFWHRMAMEHYYNHLSGEKTQYSDFMLCHTTTLDTIELIQNIK